MLYRASNADFGMHIKALASVQGADVDWEEDWYNPIPPKPPELIEKEDMRFIPIGLGYESQ